MTHSPIITPHTDATAIRVERSRDGARVHVDVLVRNGDRWQQVGASPSFPANMLSTVIIALQRAREGAA
jgi:hypothetical protein